METKWKMRLWHTLNIECVIYNFRDPAKRKLYIKTKINKTKPTNNHIHAVMGISPGLKRIYMQMWGFSLWSEFQNEHANVPEFIRSMEMFPCASNTYAKEQGCEYPQNVSCYLLSSACVVAGPISVSLKSTFYSLTMNIPLH